MKIAKATLLSILSILFICKLTLAVKLIDLPLGQTVPEQNINLNTNDDGSFYDLSYIISSTGATSGIRYRTSAITISIGGRKAIIDISTLVGSAPKGQSLYSQITVTKEDILNSIGHQYDSEISELLLNPVDNVTIGANIQIYNAGTGAVLATITEKEDVARIAGSIGFGQQDIKDMESRFQEDNTELTTSPYDGNALQSGSNGGLRPSILVP